MPEDRCIRCGKRVTWIALMGNFFLAVFKMVVGIAGNSAALIADGLHSFADVIGTSVIISTIKVSSRPSDENHPYGYGKAEFLGSTFVYIVLLFLSSAIFIGGLLMILEGEIEKPHLVTLWAGVVSLLYNIYMYLYGQCAGNKNNSPAILANSFENRADAVSSAAVIVGIATAMFIDPICDPIAAMVVGVAIFANCMVQLNEALAGLMDKAMSYESVQRIRHVAMAQEGVAGVSFVKTRQTGHSYWVDLGILVAASLNVVHSDGVASEVRNELMRRSERFHNVEVFVAPAPVRQADIRGSRHPKKNEDPNGGTK